MDLAKKDEDRTAFELAVAGMNVTTIRWHEIGGMSFRMSGRFFDRLRNEDKVRKETEDRERERSKS